MAQLFFCGTSLSERGIDRNPFLCVQFGPFTSARDRPRILIYRFQHIPNRDADALGFSRDINVDILWVSLVVF